MDWLSYLIAFGIVLAALAMLAWSLMRRARGGSGCGSGCCACSDFQPAEGCEGTGDAKTGNADSPPPSG